MKSKLPLYLEKLKKIKREHLLLGALFGVLLLVISIPTEEQKARETEPVEVQTRELTSETTGDSRAYCKDLEKQLKKVLQVMEGVGKVEVMITVKDAGETVVEKDTVKEEEKALEEDGAGTKRENSVINFQEETIYVQDTNSKSTPFVTREVKPQIEGVVVVAEGAGNAVVVKNISDAVMALFPIEVHKIKVVKMN